jgi:hypothetical protein
MKSPYFWKCSRCQWGVEEDEEAIEEKCCVGMALMQLIRWPSVIWSGVNHAGGSLFWQGASLFLPHKQGNRAKKAGASKLCCKKTTTRLVIANPTTHSRVLLHVLSPTPRPDLIRWTSANSRMDPSFPTLDIFPPSVTFPSDLQSPSRRFNSSLPDSKVSFH